MNSNPQLGGSMSFADFRQQLGSSRSTPDMSRSGGGGNKAVGLQKGAAAKSMRALPDDFQPGDGDVICGRGRNVFNHPGNERFRTIVAGYLDRYNLASAKLEKSYILSEIVTRVREASPNGGFVKKNPKTGKWMEVGDFLAREKTSQAFRDALHDKYRSSNTAKKMRRQAEQLDKTEEELDFLEHNSNNVSEFDSITASLLGCDDGASLTKLQQHPSSTLSSKLQSARSARSVLDLHSNTAFKLNGDTEPSKPSKNYNWSCPNLGSAAARSVAFRGFDDPDDELGGSMSNFNWEPVTEAPTAETRTSSAVPSKKPMRSNPFLDRLNMSSSSSAAANINDNNGNGTGNMEFASVMPLASGGSSALASFLSKNIVQQPIQEDDALQMLDAMTGEDNADVMALQSLDNMIQPNDVNLGPLSEQADSLQSLLEADIMDVPVTPQPISPYKITMASFAAPSPGGATGDTAKDSELFAKLVMLTEEDGNMGGGDPNQQPNNADAFEPTPMRAL